MMALSVADCEQLLAVLEDAPWSLIALRETLLAQREQRQRKCVRDRRLWPTGVRTVRPTEARFTSEPVVVSFGSKLGTPVRGLPPADQEER
jgi:hypothetical protein